MEWVRFLCGLAIPFLGIAALPFSYWLVFEFPARVSPHNAAALSFAVPYTVGAILLLWLAPGWLARRAERKESQKDKPPWDPARRRAHRIRWALMLLLPVLAVLLPALTFYCVLSANNPRKPDWRSGFLGAMPDTLKTWTLEMIHPFDGLSFWARRTLILGGNLSPETLLDMFKNGPKSEKAEALFGLARAAPSEALKISEDIAFGRIPSGWREDYAAAEIIAEHGSRDLLLQCMKGPSRAGSFQSAVMRRRGDQFLPELMAAVQQKVPNRAQILAYLGGVLPPEQANALWTNLLKDPDPRRRGEAAAALGNIDARPTRIELGLKYLADPNPCVQRQTLDKIGLNYPPAMCNVSRELWTRWAQHMLKLLDDPDSSLVRGAINNTEFIEGSFAMNIWQCVEPNLTLDSGGTPAPLDADEQKVRAMVKAAIQKWLDAPEKADGQR
ncbi:MAG TPA: HEAT repeat domain-containing protein [Planctomycetota bacterium]